VSKRSSANFISVTSWRERDPAGEERFYFGILDRGDARKYLSYKILFRYYFSYLLLIGFVLFRVTYTRRRRAWLFAFTSGTSLRETLTRSYTWYYDKAV